MKLHIWTNETSFLAVAHADSVAEARKLLANEVGSGDGSCPERDHAWKIITENTSAPYVGRVAAFCLSASAEASENLSYAEKVVSERDTLRAEVERLKEELAAAKAMQSTLSGTTNGAMRVAEDWKARAEAAEAQVIRLSLELAAAKEHAEYQDKECRLWANSANTGTWPLSEAETKNTGFWGRFAANMTKQRNDAIARAEKAKAHAAELRAALEAHQSLPIARSQTSSGQKYEDEVEELVERVLKATPAQSLASIQARALRDAADTLEAEPVIYTHDGYGIAARSERANVVARLRERAERLEKEAGDAQPQD